MYTWGVLGCLVAFAGVAAFTLPRSAEASPPPHAKAWGYYKVSHGHTGKEYRHEYRYGDEWEDEDWEDMRDRMEEFRSWIRDYIREWRTMRTNWQRWDYDTDTARVVTGTATDIEADRATLRATAYLDDADDADVWFEYGTKVNDLDDTSSKVTIDDDEKTVERTITDLDEDTRYYYRAVMEDEEGDEYYGTVRSFWTVDADTSDDEPTLITRSAQNIEDDRAELRGTVDMEDFDNGTVFFVYGTDQSQVEDVADDFDTYDAIDEDGADLQKVLVDQDLDGSESYAELVTSLDDDTLYYYAIGVAYENEDDDEVIALGSLRSFRTDN